ncbi:MAG: 30S ribosomal protein S4e [Candidatus Bathyarchaeota archaeon]|nr:MAG: 30S ribosomal protein S4e [Candidatus Bathyarchaeota archaeon]
MGKKGGDKRLKRMKAPAFWPIPRKRDLWTAKPSPGPHRSSRCLTLLTVIRDILNLTKTYKETRMVLSEEKVKVDGKSRRDMKFPIGVMDVVEIPDAESYYRILPSRKGLTLHSVDREEAVFKLCRIENKSSLDEALFQLNLHDGRNIIVGDKEAEEQDHLASNMKTFDVLKIGMPRQELLDHLSFDVGSYAIVTEGKNAGRHGKVVAIDREHGLRPKIVTLEDVSGNNFQTILEYVFAIGIEEPWISLPEVT